MADMNERQDIMQRDVLLVATAGASLLNGMPFSPVLLPFVVLLKPFIAGTFLESGLALTYLASFLASATTLVVAGVPAALYERATGQTESNAASLLIWLAATLALVLLPIWLIGG
jgi:hypothetical protein